MVISSERKFNGRLYTIGASTKTKKAANKWAEKYRKRGHNARVIKGATKFHSSQGKNYTIFVRQK